VAQSEPQCTPAKSTTQRLRGSCASTGRIRRAPSCLHPHAKKRPPSPAELDDAPPNGTPLHLPPHMPYYVSCCNSGAWFGQASTASTLADFPLSAFVRTGFSCSRSSTKMPPYIKVAPPQPQSPLQASCTVILQSPLSAMHPRCSADNTFAQHVLSGRMQLAHVNAMLIGSICDCICLRFSRYVAVVSTPT
jgi:hypothetical protein